MRNPATEKLCAAGNFGRAAHRDSQGTGDVGLHTREGLHASSRVAATPGDMPSCQRRTPVPAIVVAALDSDVVLMLKSLS